MTTTTAQPPENAGRPAEPAHVLLLWSQGEDRGLARLAEDLAAVLRSSSAPDRLRVTTFDIGERMGSLSLARSLVGALGGARHEATLVASLLAGELGRELGDGKLAAVVALDPTAAIIAQRWTDKGLFRAPVVGLATGLHLDGSWRRHVDRLLLIDETQAEQAQQGGFEPSDALVVGALAGPIFAAVGRLSRAELKERYGLGGDAPVVLMAAAGNDELTALLFQLTLLSHPCTLLFDADDDEDAAELLRRRARGFGLKAQLFGRVDEAAELWACADIVVARPTPRTERRTLYLRQALVALCEDGDELATGEEHKRRGRGRVVANVSTLASELDAELAAFSSEEARGRLASQPRGELAALAKAIHQVIGASAELLAKRDIARRGPHPAEAEPRAEAPAEAAAARKSPLEPIGVAEDTPAAAGAAMAEQAAEEAEANRRVGERQREVDRWEQRLRLAQEHGDRGLVAEAEKELELQRSAMHRALADLARLDESRRGRPVRAKVKAARVAADFKRMEVESALEALKRRLGLE